MPRRRSCSGARGARSASAQGQAPGAARTSSATRLVTDWAGALDRRPTVARPLWRRHSDRTNGALLSRWLPHEPGGRVLKTDLFDEATGAGLYPRLAERFAGIAGID